MRNLQSLRLLLADKDKEIEQLKKELTEEKKAHIKMYNMYVEKDNIIKQIEKCIDYYAIENDDFSKFYNNEEIEILKIIGSDKEWSNLV